MRTKGKGKKRFAIVLALIMALQCMVFSTNVFASEGDVPPMEANQKMLTGVRLGDGKAGNGDGLYYCLDYTDSFMAIDSRYIPFETKLNSSQYEAADYDFTDQLLTYKGETYAYRPNGPQAGDGKDFHYYTISFMKVDKLAKSTYGGGYLVAGGHPSSWKLVTNLKKDESTGLWKEGYYHRDYQATLHIGDAPDADEVIEEEIEEPAVEEEVIEEEAEEIEEPAVEEETIEEAEETEEPVVEEETIEEAEETEEPAIEEEAIEEETEEPAVEEEVIEEEAEETEEPAIEEETEEPAVEEPAVEEPAIEEPAIEEPAIEETEELTAEALAEEEIAAEEPADTEEESIPADEDNTPAAPADDEESTPAAPADDEESTPAAPADEEDSIQAEDKDDAPVISAATDDSNNTPAAPADKDSQKAPAASKEAPASASTEEAAQNEAPAAQTAVSSIEMNENEAPAAASAVEMSEEAAPAAASIEEEAAPQTESTGYWALINLLLAIGAALMSLLTMGLHFTRRNVLTLIPAIAAIVIFFLTENMANAMRMVDDFTLLMAVLFAANIILAVFARKSSGEKEAEQLAMAH